MQSVWFRVALLTGALCLVACSADEGPSDPAVADAAESDAAESDAPVETDFGPPPWLEGRAQSTVDFLVTEMQFAVPEALEVSPVTVANPCGLNAVTDNSTYEPLLLGEDLVVDGFDLDGADGNDSLCAHHDYVSPTGAQGIDYGFLHVMDMIRPMRPGQTVETVLKSAPAQGLVRIGIRLAGIDSIDNDDDVTVIITNTSGSPLQGADGNVLAGSSVPADPDGAAISVMKGTITDGVLLAGPGDVRIGKINLLVIEDRLVELRDAMVRGTVKERPSGGWDVDAVMAGWWERESMMEAISYAILTIGANDGELTCVLDQHMDHSLDGQSCNAMSTMIRVKAVSGYITGLETSDEGS